MVSGYWHTGFVVMDLDRSVRFYTEGLGMSLVRRFRSNSPSTGRVLGYENADVKGALLDPSGGGGGGGPSGGSTSDGGLFELMEYVEPHTAAHQISERHVIGSAHLALLVDDVNRVLKRLVEYGGTMLNEPVETEPGKTLAYAQDPDGNWLELAQIDRSIASLR